jgi:imidazolonepropionase-like amidohydrolase/Tol biopolymer transport system component
MNHPENSMPAIAARASRRNPISALALCLTLTASLSVWAKDEAPKWDVSAPHGKSKTVQFSTDEGTWLDLDVAPDGKTIAFSMLGDIYTLPMTGGLATRILSGKAFEVQPRFSPDGKRLSFTSDRAGGDNIWTAKVDGTDLQQVSKESFRLLNNAEWTPDGQFLIARKHFTAGRSLGAGEMWLYHASGGDGVQLTTKKNDQQDAGQPAISPDGRYVYFSEDVSAGPNFQYNKDPHEIIYAIRRLDRDSGDLDDLITVQGGAISPTPSPDGKTLVFVRRVREKTALFAFDLASSEMRMLWDGLSHDQQESWAIFGPYPNLSFTPDSSAVIVWAQGKLWRVPMDAKTAPSQIAFQAEVKQLLDEPVRAVHRIDQSSEFLPTMIRDVATSQDGKTIVFHSVGKLWRKQLPNGKPERLTADESSFEYSPSFSPDGENVIYVRWTDQDMGAIYRIPVTGGAGHALTTTPAVYATPSYSHDGKQIVYAINTGGNLIDFRYSQNAGIFVMPSAGGEAKRIAKAGSQPFFDAESAHIFYLSGGGLEKKLMRTGFSGEATREIFNLKYVDFIVPSPNGKFVAFTELFDAYVAPLPSSGSSIELSKDSTAIPVAKVSQDVGSYLHWASDSQSLHWLVGRKYFSRKLSDTLPYLSGNPKNMPKASELVGVDVDLSVPLDQPAVDEIKAFTHARIITMQADKADAVIEDGTVIVQGEKILSVGKNLTIPAGARVIDATGKTIMPGIIDVHAHANHFHNGPSPQANWAYYANLAFGITTMHDPSANTQEVFSQSELVKAGLNVGPRIFSTGTILYGADGDFKAVINSIDDARAHLRRLKAQGAWSIKSYNQPRRDQRQQINQAARELGMTVVMEGGSTFNHNLTMILDGSTGIEHNLPVAPLYRDVIGTWKATDVRNTPTLVVAYGGINGEYWFYEHDKIWENQKLLRFFPRETLDARSIRRQLTPEWDYYHVQVSKAVKQLHDAGIGIQVGGHGQLQGLSPHWEIWLLTQGGMSNLEALQAATIRGASYLGLSQDIGSIEAGKLADLIVLNSNPLDNIRATIDSAYVMVNGRLFNAETMQEIGGKERAQPEFYWQRHGGVSGNALERLLGPTSVCHCPKGGG